MMLHIAVGVLSHNSYDVTHNVSDVTQKHVSNIADDS